MAYTEKRLAELKGWMENVIEHDVERQYIKSFLKESIQQAVAEERGQAYTRLVEGIEGVKPHVRNVPPSDKQSIEAVCLVQVGYEQCKKDILENVVNPLYSNHINNFSALKLAQIAE